MNIPIQPQFKIRVYDGQLSIDKLKGARITASTDGDYIDIEQCVAYPVIYEEQASLLNTLTFTVDKYADILLYYFYIGQKIIFYGGYYSDSEGSMRHVFSGTVTRIKTKFSDNGKVSFSVECMNYGFVRLGKEQKNFVYPDEDSSRKFAATEGMTLTELITGIAKENNYDIGEIDLSDEAKEYRLTTDNIRYQKNESDWKFLTRLANDFGCCVWVTSENGSERLNFMSNSKAFSRQEQISFLFPLYGVVTDIRDSEMQKFPNGTYNRPRILREVTVDEDVSLAYSVTRSAVYFDKETGDYKEAVAKIVDNDGKRYIEFYTLDEARVQYVDQHMPDIAEFIRNNSPASLPWGTPDNPRCASYYYKVYKVYDETTAVFDKAFFGITVTAKCNQDLDIHSQRTYMIRGILSYHSKNLETSFFLRGLKHVWDSDGNTTELDFIR